MSDDDLLAAIFGTGSFARVMAVFVDRPGELLSAGEVERLSDVKSRDSLYRAIDRGIRSGLVLRRSFGRTGAYEINTASPLYPGMKTLLSRLTGIAGELQAVVSRHGGVKAAFVYGSAAAGQDVLGSDVDLFVTGEVNEAVLIDQLHVIELRLGREINAMILSTEVLQRRLTAGDPLLADIWTKPRTMLVGEEESLPRLAVPEPNPYFHQEMAVGGQARPYTTVVVGAVAGRQDEVTEHALDVVDAWVREVKPDATTERASAQVGWWQVVEGLAGARWQTWLYPGPVISVRDVAPMTPRGPGSAAIVLRDLAAQWKRALTSVTTMMIELGCETVQVGLTLNTYGSGDEPRLVDIDFAGLAAPTPGAVPGQVPPWTYASQPLHPSQATAEIVDPAVRSLLRQFSFRHLDDTIRSLDPIRRAPADR